jgi:hypothetical protein
LSQKRGCLDPPSDGLAIEEGVVEAARERCETHLRGDIKARQYGAPSCLSISDVRPQRNFSWRKYLYVRQVKESFEEGRFICDI